MLFINYDLYVGLLPYMYVFLRCSMYLIFIPAIVINAVEGAGMSLGESVTG